MKRLMILLLALLLAALPALAETQSAFDFTQSVADDGALVFTFPEVTLRLPADWAGKVTVLQTSGGASFYQTASYEKYLAEGLEGGGFLFSLGASVNGSFSQLPAFEYLGFSEDSAMNYYLVLPTDYPAYMEDAIRAEYDAMHAQMDYIVANAQVCPDEAEAPQTADAATDEAAGWTPAQVRYQFEHSVLPRYFHEVPENMLSVMKEVGAYKLWESYAAENGVDPAFYPAEDYVEHWYAAGESTTLLQIEMPQPDDNTLCYRVYMVYDAATGATAYYTVEIDTFLDVTAFLCSWAADRTHTLLEGAPILDKNDADYEANLAAEAAHVAELAGAPAGLIDAGIGIPGGESGGDASNLAAIECPEQGFATVADPAYAWDYQEGTGISIYTENAGSIPYVIVFRAQDLIGEPLEYIREQYTPHMQSQYGDDLVSFVEYEQYDIGGKQLPAGLYTYRLQGYLIDMLRLFDSTGDRTVVYTAKYINGQGDATLAALDAAIRGFTTLD